MFPLTQDSAQSGGESALESAHGFIEFCTIALQITLVVYRAYRLVVFVKLTLPHPSNCWYLEG